jgi:hypothetical protein
VNPSVPPQYPSTPPAQTPPPRPFPAGEVWADLLKTVSPHAGWLLTLLAGLAVLLVDFSLMWQVRHHSVREFDEGIVMVYPEQMLKGLVPNRDFFTLYPPGNYWIIATDTG